MKVPNFYMMIGLPGSGKSHYAMHELDGFIISSDALRKELWGSEEIQGDNNMLFAELHKRIKYNLSTGFDTIFDATNLSYKKRKAFLDELKNIPCNKIGILMATPYNVCLNQNASRDRKVPEEVIKRMLCQFNAPYWYEGWDEIKVVHNIPENVTEFYPYEFPDLIYDFPQDNVHHTLTLDEHSKKCARLAADYAGYPSLVWNAAFIHDGGKPITKDFHDSRGNESTDAHYYNHQNAGAYDCFQYKGLTDAECLYVAQLVQWHMHPYTSWKDSERSMKRDRSLLGEELFNDIMLLHKCDEEAH